MGLSREIKNKFNYVLSISSRKDNYASQIKTIFKLEY